MKYLPGYIAPAVLVFFGWVMLTGVDQRALEREAKLAACAGTYTIWVTRGGSLSYGYQTDYYSNDGDLIVFINNCNGKKHITPKTSILEINEN